MANARMFPPGDGRHSTTSVNGRPYTCAVSSFVDVPTFDADVLAANGWTRAGGPTTTVGPTSSRPTSSASGQPLTPGHSYIDTTLGYGVTWDRLAGVWRSDLTGAPV